ncbi:COG3772 Phage-related lysozyme (muraminidase) [uncultured Caudovirales phage]|jgi:lysozyme|uniref:Endolysin n=1 Tax=uncultured Caudovirales phage TaxID=2100421 RepID=A0A6J7XNM2_9CAUD|nr:COG3772 Phage-related lysozyme (muraminidase) [uncultured Caudovirales phage]
MKVSDKLIQMIKHDEGVRVKPYRCPALIWTVGVGHVIDQAHIKVPIEERKTLPIPSGWDRTLSMDEVNAILAKDLETFERGVLRLAPNLAGRQGKFDACVSFSFNVGLGNFQRSTIRMKIQREEWDAAADAFLMWTKAGGKELPGLVKRRKGERALFMSN